MFYVGTSLKNEDFEVSILCLGKYSMSAVNYHPVISTVLLKYWHYLETCSIHTNNGRSM